MSYFRTLHSSSGMKLSSSSDGVKYDNGSVVLAKSDGDVSVACFVRNLVRIHRASFFCENAPPILLAASF